VIVGVFQSTISPNPRQPELPLPQDKSKFHPGSVSAKRE